jgi:ABC-2 type transport system ATP-binding protein
MNKSLVGGLLAALVFLSACGSSSNSEQGVGGETRAGEIRRVEIPSPVDGSIVFQLFEPTQLVAGQRYPLILEGHGYGGSRRTEATGLLADLIDGGYYVISIDQRGFGESTGPVRVMDPDAEGRDLVAILDWAETELAQVARDGSGRMMVGSYGSSYGGGYQFLLQAVDPQRRLRAMVPDIAWHDLVYSLNPGGAIKSGWALFLVAGGEAGSQLGQDNVIRETLVRGLLTNTFPEAGQQFFRYHSPKYFCDGEVIESIDFALGTEIPMTPPIAPPAVDVMLWQGFKDTLFNATEALDNFNCFRDRGGDVRLLTHQSGHILPLGVGLLSEDLDEALDALAGLLTLPEYQSVGGSNNCGSISRDTATLAWFDEKLKGISGRIDEVITTGTNICLSLADGDAIEVAEFPVGGESFAVETMIPEFNGVLGLVGGLLGTQVPGGITAIELMTIGDDGAILAGNPTFNLTLSPLLGLGLDSCLLPILPLACDPILYIGLGKRSPGQNGWTLIDDQLQAIRGFGEHGNPQSPARMVAVAERLLPGDELALMVYGFHPQYLGTFSRDVLVPATNLSGHVQVPLLSPQQIVREGV